MWDALRLPDLHITLKSRLNCRSDKRSAIRQYVVDSKFHPFNQVLVIGCIKGGGVIECLYW